MDKMVLAQICLTCLDYFVFAVINIGAFLRFREIINGN